jgi:hypothetical protein
LVDADDEDEYGDPLAVTESPVPHGLADLSGAEGNLLLFYTCFPTLWQAWLPPVRRIFTGWMP